MFIIFCTEPDQLVIKPVYHVTISRGQSLMMNQEAMLWRSRTNDIPRERRFGDSGQKNFSPYPSDHSLPHPLKFTTHMHDGLFSSLEALWSACGGNEASKKPLQDFKLWIYPALRCHRQADTLKFIESKKTMIRNQNSNDN